MKHIYCISGFGADERLFSHLNFGDNYVHFIQWKIPLPKETMVDYVARMAEEIVHPNPILAGISFGGMVSIEIAKTISIEKIILISSVKNFHEMPLYMRLTGKSKINKIFPLKPYSFLEPIENYNLGITNEEEKSLANEYRKNINPIYLDWSINEIVNWKNDWRPENLLHIHGSNDHIFPLKKIKADYVIPDGGHFMVMNKADEVSQILKEIL
ncbi:MAG: alpha/beta hydrolase [Ginsengibacter sp.]